MAEPINFRLLTEDERSVLVKAIPTLHTTQQYYWDDNQFFELYKEWLGVTNGRFQKGGMEQFRLAVSMFRKHIPITYKQGDSAPMPTHTGDLITKAQRVRRKMVGAAYE